MKTSQESKLLVELEYEQNLLDSLTDAEQRVIQQRAVKRALAKLDDYYLNATEV
jgi:hypothetical protein